MVCDICAEIQERLFVESNGSCGQVICNHMDETETDDDGDDEGATATEFPSLQEFEDVQQQVTVKFRDLPIQQVYQIKGIKKLSTKSGPAMILDLLHETNGAIRVWATSLIQKELKDVVIGKMKKERLFIVSKGEKCAQSSKNRYLNYKIVKKPRK